MLIPLMLALPLWFETHRNRAVGQASPLLHPPSPRMEAALLDYIRRDDNLQPMLIARPSDDGDSNIDIGVILMARDPVEPTVYGEIKAIVSEVLGHDAAVWVGVVKEGWRERPFDWKDVQPDFQETLEHLPEPADPVPDEEEVTPTER